LYLALAKPINVSSITTSAPSAHDDLQVLIKDCLAQSRVAQKKLYERYSPDAYGIIKRYIYNNEQLAKEVLNDAFFKIFRDLHQYSFQGAFEGWIRRIIVHTISDHLRKNIKESRQHREIMPDDAYINNESVENLSHKELLKLVQALPDAQREVFNLFVFENLSHNEIAKLLNIKNNNCRWHLNDARRRLKEMISSLVKKEKL
jgi:RNA polymerase sigma-70 factor (ECF subfamily)